jgi:hypothetical protein
LKRLFSDYPCIIPVLVLGFLLPACTGYTPPPPTETASPTPTRRPTEKNPPTQMELPAETPTEAPLPTQRIESALTEPAGDPVEIPFRLGEVQQVGDGGFHFQPVIGYNVNVLPGQATLVSKDGGIVLSLVGGDVPGASALEGVMDRLLAKVSEDFEEFEASDPYPITVDETRGLATNVSAELIGKPITGKVAVVAPSDSQLFYAFAFTVEEPDDRWESEGNEVFEAVIDSVQFYELDDESSP